MLSAHWGQQGHLLSYDTGALCWSKDASRLMLNSIDLHRTPNPSIENRIAMHRYMPTI